MAESLFALNGPSLVVFGDGALGDIGALARKLSGTRALIITDPNVVRNGTVQEATRRLEEAGLTVRCWDGVVEEPSTAMVAACREWARQERFDLLLALGGGSVMDLAKVVGVLMSHGGTVYDYFGPDLVPGRGLPTIMVPTTAGTGAETTPNAIIRDEQDGAKKALVSRHLVPDAVVLDPRTTVSLPPTVTAATGLDALTHSVESLVGRRANPLSDGVALESIRLIFGALDRAVQDGRDLPARSDLLMASFLGGVALSVAGTASVHALAYGLGTFGVAHGVANGLLLPVTLEFNAPACEAKLARMAEMIGAAAGAGSPGEAAARAVQAIAALVARLPVPHRLAELGLNADHLPHAVEVALSNARLLDNSPREIGRSEAMAVYRRLL
ncbi:MAG: iron-containing alcohol dehydrogenase [Bacillota bacterium]|nr:iron-containing alcohol dehydrogenase [Bacillota bacterium]